MKRHIPPRKKIVKDQTKVLPIMQKELTSIGKILQRKNQNHMYYLSVCRVAGTMETKLSGKEYIL